MTEGLEIILERIKTNPEEFYLDGETNRWIACIIDYWHVLTPEEQTQIREALRELHRASFKRKVLLTLMLEKNTGPTGKYYRKM